MSRRDLTPVARNRLQVILSAVEQLERDEITGSEEIEYLSELEREARRLADQTQAELLRACREVKPCL